MGLSHVELVHTFVNGKKVPMYVGVLCMPSTEGSSPVVLCLHLVASHVRACLACAIVDYPALQ